MIPLLRAVAGPPVRRPWLLEVEWYWYLLVVFLMFAAEQYDLAEGRPPQMPSSAVGWVLGMLPIVLVVAVALSRWWRPRWAGGYPAVAALAVCLAVYLAELFSTTPWERLFLALMIGPWPVLLTAAVRRARAVPAVLAVVCALAVLPFLVPVLLGLPGARPTRIDPGGLVRLGNLLLAVVMVLVPIALGAVLRFADNQARSRELDRVRAAERRQVARELHDLIANHVTGMTMYAQGAGARPEVSDPVRGALAAIESSGHDALAAMHRMVAVLRSDADPGLGSLDALPTTATDLSGAVRSAVGETEGVTVTLDAPPHASTPPVLLSTVHRVVVEGLTNVRRHAADARDVRVALWAPRTGVLAVEVSNDGAARTARRDDGGGFGLAGLRERVAALDGTVHTGPAGKGSWLLRAELPLDAPPTL